MANPEFPNPINWAVPGKENYDSVEFNPDRKNRYTRIIWRMKALYVPLLDFHLPRSQVRSEYIFDEKRELACFREDSTETTQIGIFNPENPAIFNMSRQNFWDSGKDTSPDYSYLSIDFLDFISHSRNRLGDIVLENDHLNFIRFPNPFITGIGGTQLQSPDELNLVPQYDPAGVIRSFKLECPDADEDTRITEDDEVGGNIHSYQYFYQDKHEYTVRWSMRNGMVIFEQEYARDFDGEKVVKIMRVPLNINTRKVIETGFSDTYDPETGEFKASWMQVLHAAGNPGLSFRGPLAKLIESLGQEPDSTVTP